MTKEATVCGLDGYLKVCAKMATGRKAVGLKRDGQQVMKPKNVCCIGCAVSCRDSQQVIVFASSDLWSGRPSSFAYLQSCFCLFSELASYIISVAYEAYL